MGLYLALYALFKPIYCYALIIHDGNYSKAAGVDDGTKVLRGPLRCFGSYQVAYHQFLVLYPQGWAPLWKKMALKSVLSIGIFRDPRNTVSVQPRCRLEVLIGPCYP